MYITKSLHEYKNPITVFHWAVLLLWKFVLKNNQFPFLSQVNILVVTLFFFTYSCLGHLYTNVNNFEGF